jgi:hypothetical protein
MDINNINLESLTYEDFIKKFKIYNSSSEARAKGYEAHHIIPISIQQKDRKDPTIDDRCVRCTAFEHTLLHYLLARDKGDKYIHIFGCFCDRNFNKLSDIEKLTLEELQNFGRLREEGFKKIGENTSKCLKGRPFTESHKKAISEASKGKKLSKETKDKLSKINSQRKWYNNGTIETNTFKCPEGYVPGRLKKFSEKMSKENNPRFGKEVNNETRNKISEANKKFYNSHTMEWYNNGLEEKPIEVGNPIPNGFIKGRLPMLKESKEKQRESMLKKNLKWYNNGIEELRSSIQPEGYSLGRLKKYIKKNPSD